MVTLITEKLQSQSLDDLAHKSCDASPCSAEKLNNASGPWSPFETCQDRCPRKAPSGGLPNRSQATVVPTLPFSPGPCRVSMGLGAVSAGDLRESSGPPSAPPSKRHCRSLSEPDEHARCQSPWRPGGSRVWTAVSKRRCHSGGSSCLPGGACLAAGPGLPPVPRPASASSSFLDRNGSGSGPPWCPMGTYALSPRRRLSLSQEHLADADSPPSPPELGWRLGLPRSRSQPCVLVGRTSRLKRRRDEGTRWLRPSLDFQKMTRTLKNSKSLSSLDCEGEDDDDPRAKTAVSRPRDPRDPHGLVTPGSSPCGLRELVASEGGGSGDPSAWDSAWEEGVLPLDPGALDLEQIENN
ncbi:protein FAM53A isoform X1 [Desmodus rotundus]|uniref:protein FAM53A isoform X1 n=1 Tax=Desmodus rotundus TaxID=9430 RepID=UPI002381924D|nr:protein FAM53A isoform X1 [Desmodus rotundus]